MNGILYFSSTGNSLYIAKRLQERIGGELRYIPKYERDGSEYEKIYIVSPIYSFGMPLHVADLLTRLDKNAELTVVLNYGGMAGGADRLVYEYALKYGLNVKSVFKLQMPENFTLTFTVPKFYLKSVLKKADGRIDAVLEKISGGEANIPKSAERKRKRG